FSIGHADCGGSSTFSFYMNATLLGTAPSSQGCKCNDAPLVVAFTDQSLLARFQPTSCNSFRVDVSHGETLALGFVSVTVETPAGRQALCLSDGDPANRNPSCTVRNLCALPGFRRGASSVGDN